MRQPVSICASKRGVINLLDAKTHMARVGACDELFRKARIKGIKV
jgi:hypothetical protein